MKKYLDKNQQFPIMYENSKVVVYRNSSNEIFVESKKSIKGMRSKIRVNIDHGEVCLTATGCLLLHQAINGMDRVVVRPLTWYKEV